MEKSTYADLCQGKPAPMGETLHQLDTAETTPRTPEPHQLDAIHSLIQWQRLQHRHATLKSRARSTPPHVATFTPDQLDTTPTSCNQWQQCHRSAIARAY